jgi:hypothetical protein
MDIELEVVILQDGSIGLFTRSGSFPQGVTAIGKLLEALGTAGIQVVEVSDIETHAHGPDATVWNFEEHHQME